VRTGAGECEQRGRDHHSTRWTQQQRCGRRAQQPSDRNPREDGALEAREQSAAVEQREQRVARRGDCHQRKPDAQRRLSERLASRHRDIAGVPDRLMDRFVSLACGGRRHAGRLPTYKDLRPQGQDSSHSDSCIRPASGPECAAMPSNRTTAPTRAVPWRSRSRDPSRVPVTSFCSRFADNRHSRHCCTLRCREPDAVL